MNVGTVGFLIAELQKLPAEAPVRVAVACPKDTVFSTTGEVTFSGTKDGVTLRGWAANTRFDVERNDADDDEAEGSDDE